MKKLLVALALFLAGCTSTLHTVKISDDLVVTIFDEKCTVDVAKNTARALGAPEQDVAKLKQAEVLYLGNKFKACVYLVEDGSFHIMDEQGGYGMSIPLKKQ